MGAVTITPFENGGSLLHAVTNHLFGSVGGIILGIAVLFACLTTAIGLTTSFSDYFQTLLPRVSYKKIAAFVCLFSFVISNVGLSQLIKIALPILLIIYPVTVTLILLSFMRRFIKHRKSVYIVGMGFTFIVAFLYGLDTAGLSLGSVSVWVRELPFYELGLSWVLPGAIGSILGALPFLNKTAASAAAVQE